MNRLRIAFEHSQSERQGKNAFRPDEFVELVDGIERALVRFESTSNHAVLRLYRRSGLLPSSRPHSVASISSAREEECLPWNDNASEQVFLVYLRVQFLLSSLIRAERFCTNSFIFTLQEFAREMISLMDAMRRIYDYEEKLRKLDPCLNRIAKDILKRMTSRGGHQSLNPRVTTRTFCMFFYPHPAMNLD